MALRPWVSSAAIAVLASLALALPPSAAAQGATNPFTPGFPAPSPTQTATTPTAVTPTTSTTSTGGGSLGSGGAIAIAVGALLVLGGISFFIWRDARRRAPVRHRRAVATAGEGSRPGSKPRAKPRKLSQAERRRRKRGRAR